MARRFYGETRNISFELDATRHLALITLAHQRKQTLKVLLLDAIDLVLGNSAQAPVASEVKRDA